MDLNLTTENLSIRDMFAKFFLAESTSATIRAAEPVGFDRALWDKLVALGIPSMCLGAEEGGLSLFDGTLIMEEAGRRLAPAPIAEVAVAVKLLSMSTSDTAAEWIESVQAGEKIVVVALREASGQPQLVPGGAAAHGIVLFDGEQLRLIELDGPLSAPETLGGAALAMFDPAPGEGIVLASGPQATAAWSEAVETWRLLTSAALTGLGLQAIELGSAYARERTSFGVPIGVNQAVAHPLADSGIALDGARLLLWRTLRGIADGEANAGASVAELWWWANQTASVAVARALHFFGGYGLTNEYDIQLYNRRAKAWGLVLGDPNDALIEAGRRLYHAEVAFLPGVGEVPVDFSTSPAALDFAAETRDFFNSILTPELRAKAHYGIQTHDWGVSKALGAAGLLFPDWPVRWGGREVDRDSARASLSVWQEFDWTVVTQGTTGLIGRIIMDFADETVQQETLPRMAAGEIVACLGYSEPSSGSDIFAAKTRAVRDGDDWVINGQKMFTSGADLASYVLLLTRTDPDVPKHKGLTMFLVPMDTPGIEVHPVHTFADEQTNATFYTDVRIPDRYRLGDVNGAMKVMTSALRAEQSGASWHNEQRRMTEIVAAWARTEMRGNTPLIDKPDVLARLARVDTHARLGQLFSARSSWWSDEGKPDLAYGPTSKIFTTDSFISDSRDMLDLTAPMSLMRGRNGLGYIEQCYRYSAATSIYAGTSEVLRSLVAERQQGMPRSRA